jgi:plasmid stabilization system protein ParE
MTFEVRFRVEAETDLVEIRKYYLKISESVTDNFFKEFFETLNFIKQTPKLFQERYRGIRIAPLYKFPYGIHYIEKDNQITILRVLHYKRYFK